MDVEKTLQLISESQLRAERRADKADQRMDRFDKQLRATANLVKVGMKMAVEMRQEQREARQERREMRHEQREMRQEIHELQKEWEYKYNALLDSQMRTDEEIRKHEQALAKNEEKFNRLLEILSRKHRNGHG